MLLWAAFTISAAIIVVCGTFLSKYGDVIAEKTGLGRAWIGLILMASITSLPELITGVSSVTIAGVPNIAAGDVTGSCVFNLIILAVLDPLDRVSPIFSKAAQSHLMTAGFGIALLGITSVSILLDDAMPAVGHIGLYTPLIIFIYIVGIRMVYSYEKRIINNFVKETAERLLYERIALRKAAAIYALNAAIVVVVAAGLPFIAGRLAETTGLGGSFMGSVFVAITTSLPELVVSVSAMRMGANDLAIGNLLGSNMFNIVLLAVDDILYTKGPILSHISDTHATTALMAILMTAVVLVSITYRFKKKAFYRFGWDSITMLSIGLLNMYFVYFSEVIR